MAPLMPIFKPTQPARVTKGTFIGVYWGGVFITAVLFAFRIYVRMEKFRRVYADDLLVLAAWMMLLTSAIIWQFNKDILYEEMAAASGHLVPLALTASVEHDIRKALRGSLVVIIFFYSCLWSVKVSFLIFFRRLGHNVKGQKHLWWFVLIITLTSYAACLVIINYKCLAARSHDTLWYCSSPQNTLTQRRQIFAAVVIDVVTDALIIVVPVTMLWKVQINLRQKLGLIGIFSISVFVIVFAIIRVALVISYSTIPDQSWLYLWSAIEQTVAITVACLGSYRALFVKQGSSCRITESETSASIIFPRKTLPSKAHGQTLHLRNLDTQMSTVIYTHNHNDHRLSKSPPVGSAELSIPPNRVLVKETIHTEVSSKDASGSDLSGPLVGGSPPW